MKTRKINIDKDKCMSCLNCVLGCMAEHNLDGDSIYDLDLENPDNHSRNHVEFDSNDDPVPIICRHCTEPECVLTCMSGAMTKNEETGHVEYDEEQCASCFMCVMSCPYGVLKPDRVNKKVIIKCNMCGDRDTPRCVEECPTGTLSVVEVEV